MSAIAGVVQVDGGPVDPNLVGRMIDRLRHRAPDSRNAWSDASVGLAHGMLFTTPESLRESQPVGSPDGSLMLVSDARIDNRHELIAALGMSASHGALLPDSHLILAAYREWADDCPRRLLGDFAFAVWDKSNQSLFCARDPAGVKCLYYCRRRHLVAFASEIKALFEVPEIHPELNESRIADHLLMAFEDGEDTFFSGIHRLRPGHWMRVEKGGRRMCRYWVLDAEHELKLGSDGEYEEAFREVFTEAVRCRLRSAFPVGSTLSGGLDSSSIACTGRECLKAIGEEDLHTFSAVFPGLDGPELARIDERKYMREALAGGGMVGHEVLADRLDPLGDLRQVLWWQDDPLVPFNLYIHLAIYRSARDHNVRVLLDGTDGDTTVSHGMERLAELAKTLRWIALFNESRAVARQFRGAMSSWQVVRQHALEPLIPPGIRILWNRLRPQADGGAGCESLVAKDFAGRMERRAALRRRESVTFRRFESARSAHRASLESPLLAYLLELADKAAAANSIEARYPFFDRRLMEFCLALPAEQKLRAGWGRSILRRAMEGRLPPAIQWRRTKADLSPNFHRGVLNTGGSTLDGLVEELGVSGIGRFLDVEALRALYQRYRKHPTNHDGMSLFMALTLSNWLSGLHQEASAGRST